MYCWHWTKRKFYGILYANELVNIGVQRKKKKIRKDTIFVIKTTKFVFTPKQKMFGEKKWNLNFRKSKTTLKHEAITNEQIIQQNLWKKTQIKKSKKIINSTEALRAPKN